MEIELVKEMGDEFKELDNALWRQHDESTHGPEVVAQWVGRDAYRKSINLIAYNGDIVVGWATGWMSEGVGYLNDLMIEPDQRNRGTGTELLKRWEDEARVRQLDRLALRTIEAHNGAIDFYEKHGWVKEVALPDWLAGHNYVQMRKDLADKDERTREPWEQVGSTIRRDIAFEDFTQAIEFVDKVAHLAEAANHHPDIDIRCNTVRLVLTTHSAGGLTDKDFALAAVIDALL